MQDNSRSSIRTRFSVPICTISSGERSLLILLTVCLGRLYLVATSVTVPPASKAAKTCAFTSSLCAMPKTVPFCPKTLRVSRHPPPNARQEPKTPKCSGPCLKSPKCWTVYPRPPMPVLTYSFHRRRVAPLTVYRRSEEYKRRSAERIPSAVALPAYHISVPFIRLSIGRKVKGENNPLMQA